MGVTLVPRNRPSSQASPPLPVTTQIVDPAKSPGPVAVDPAGDDELDRPVVVRRRCCECAGFDG